MTMFKRNNKYKINMQKSGSYSNCFESAVSIMKALQTLQVESLKKSNFKSIEWDWGRIEVITDKEY